MPQSSITFNTFNPPARPTPQAPTITSTAVGVTPDEVVLTVNVPTIDTDALPLTGANKVNRITLYWSLEPLPTDIASLTSSTQPTIKSVYNGVDADVAATTAFTFSPVKPGYPVYVALFASND